MFVRELPEARECVIALEGDLETKLRLPLQELTKANLKRIFEVDIEDVILSSPDDHVADLKNRLKCAGLRVLRTLNSVSAICLNLQDQSEYSAVALFVDPSRATLCLVNHDEGTYEVLKKPITSFSESIFLKRIANYVKSKCQSAMPNTVEQADADRINRRLEQAVSQAFGLHSLHDQKELTVTFDCGLDEPSCTTAKVPLGKLHEFVADFTNLLGSEAGITDLLRTARLSKKAIKYVVLSGGLANLLKVRDLFEEALPASQIISVHDLDQSVFDGLSRLHGQLAANAKEIAHAMAPDLLQCSVYLERPDKKKVLLAERGAKLPIRSSSLAAFEQPADSQVLLVFKEGDRTLSTENDLLFNLLLPPLGVDPVAPRVTVREVSICLVVSKSGLLSIEAHDTADVDCRVSDSAKLANGAAQHRQPPQTPEKLNSSLKEKKEFAEHLEQRRKEARRAFKLLDLTYHLAKSKRVQLVIDEPLQAELCASLTECSVLAGADETPNQPVLDRIVQQSEAVLAILQESALEKTKTQNPNFPSAANSILDKIASIRAHKEDMSIYFGDNLEDLQSLDAFEALLQNRPSPFLRFSDMGGQL